jgi:DNA polymerase-1
MIEFSNGGRLVKRIAEIPSNFVGAHSLFLDSETSSGSPKEDSLNPWRHCNICGFSITVDDCPNAYYADCRYTEDFWSAGPQFIQDVLWYCVEWINHHIKYDMHVFSNCFGTIIPPWLQCRCTIVSARLIDSDRGGSREGYALDKLSKHWLKHDISEYEARLQPYLGRNNKDYGRIPSDIAAEYGCQDVLTERNLHAHIQSRIPERGRGVERTEIALTKELYKLEKRGMRFDETQMMLAQLKSLNRMSQLDAEISKLTGMDFRPAVNEDCNKVLCGKYGLPIVAYTKDSDGEETENASFDKKALALYKGLPYAPQDVISRIIEYRAHNQRNNLFYTPILSGGWNGCIHPNYGQNDARTGRMTCKQPNAQQFDETILGLILPGDGNSIISTDASQIEKRLVVHYIQNKVAIAAYQKDSTTDFYKLIADMCGIDRQSAKAVDLGIGYGEGEKKLVGALKINPGIVNWAKAEVEKLPLTSLEEKTRAFEYLAESRGKMIYKAYHDANPTLKPTAKAAEAAVKRADRRLGLANDSNHYYGYITNLYGRDRHISYAKYRNWSPGVKDPYDRAWLAFPSLNQGTAADLMKERFVALMQAIGDRPIYPFAIVHDEIAMIAPTEVAEDFRCQRDIVGILEEPAVKIDVPIRWSIGTSRENWLAAATSVKDGGASKLLQYNKAEKENFKWL